MTRLALLAAVLLLTAIAGSSVLAERGAEAVTQTQAQTVADGHEESMADAEAVEDAEAEGDAEEFEDEGEDEFEDEAEEGFDDEFEAEDDIEFDAEADAEVAAEAQLDTAAGAKVATTVVVANAVDAFLTAQNNQLKSGGSNITPFWGKMPECCLASRSYDFKAGDMNYLCTVYSFWQCLPAGRICDEQKPYKEPEPLTYTVTPTKMDPSLGSFVCYSNCKQCKKPRTSDISKTILGSLKSE